jgi:beta-glucosidase
MAKEFKSKGVQVALGPVVGPIGRIAEGGRNWEGEHLLQSHGLYPVI